MKINQLQNTSLRYFLEVVRSGSITEAAQRINVSPSAISRQISSLEDILETSLFERQPRGMIPSPAGELLAAYARSIASESERIVTDIQSLNSSSAGHVRIACTTGFTFDFLPRLIADFRKEHPGVKFSLHVDTPQGVSKCIQEREVDIGLTFSRALEKNIRVEYSLPAPLTAVMRPNHPLASQSSVSLKQLQSYPLSVLTPDNTLRVVFDIACSLNQISIEPVFTSNQLVSLRDYAYYSGDIFLADAILMLDAIQKGDFVSIPISDRGFEGRNLEIHSFEGRTLPKTVELFLERVKSEFQH
jgi:DNA-binding transcriptional LysR family regulator